jgi:uncharacterized protein
MNLSFGPLSYLLFGVIGLLAGILAALLGLGGGFVVVPALISLGFAPQVAAGTSLAFIVGTGLGATRLHLQSHNIDLKFVLKVSLSAVAAAQVVSLGSAQIPGAWLQMSFGLLLWGLIWLQNQAKPEETLEPVRPTVSWKKASLMGMSIGSLAGLFGIGGGLLFIPLQVRFLNIPFKRAVGNSALAISLTGLSGAIGHLWHGHLSVVPVVCMWLGSFIGLPIGKRLFVLSSPVLLKRLLNLLMALLGGYMLIRGILS